MVRNVMGYHGNIMWTSCEYNGNNMGWFKLTACHFSALNLQVTQVPMWSYCVRRCECSLSIWPAKLSMLVCGCCGVVLKTFENRGHLCSIYATNSCHILPCNLGRWEWVRAQFSTSNWRKDHRSWLPLWGFLGGRNQICWWWSLTARCDEESDGKWGWWTQIMVTLWWSNIGHFYGHLNMT